jgi:hypothetical protein
MTLFVKRAPMPIEGHQPPLISSSVYDPWSPRRAVARELTPASPRHG